METNDIKTNVKVSKLCGLKLCVKGRASLTNKNREKKRVESKKFKKNFEKLQNMNIHYLIPAQISQAYTTPINIEVKQEVLAAHSLFNCAYCNETFRSKKDLKGHKDLKHPQIKTEQRIRKPKTEPGVVGNTYIPTQAKFTCEYCYKGFDQSHRLKQHQISHREPAYNCDQVIFKSIYHEFLLKLNLFAVRKEIQVSIST